MRRLWMLVLAAAVLVVMAVPSALAAGGGKPLVNERYDYEYAELPDFLVLSECGLEVETEFHFWGHFMVNADNTSRNHFNGEAVTTDPDSGEVLLIRRNAYNTFHEVPVGIVDEEAGTLTYTFEETVRGMPTKWRIPGEGVILLDAGTVTVITTWVIDLVTGDFISIDVIHSDMHGPHPSMTQLDGEVAEILCEAMGA